MTVQNTDFGRVADDLRRAAASFALLTSNATAFGVSLNSFREFERALISTNAVAQGTAQNYAQMEKAARSFALATTTSAVEAVDALQNLAQAGFTAQESLQAMTGVLLLASATLTDVGQAADLISANIRAFNLEASETTRVSNLFVAAITSGLASMDKLTFAFRQVAPVADVANLSIEETTAFLNELFNVGLRGEQAGTALRNVIVRLVRPTGEAADILRELGIATVDATGNLRPLEQILKELAKANLGEADLAKIFENEALAGALTLMKSVSVTVDGATTSYQKMLKEISGTQDALILTLKNMSSLDAQLKLLKNSFTDVAITIGEELAPYVEQIASYLRELIQTYRELDPETKEFYNTLILIGVGIVGILGTLNALILLFGTATASVVSFSLSMGGIPLIAAITGLAGFTGGVDAAIISLGVMLAAMKVYAAYMAGTLLPAIRAAATALFFFAATNPVVAGIIAITAVLGAAAAAFGLLRGEAEKTQEELARIKDVKIKVSAEFDKAASSAGIGNFALKELQSNTDLARSLADSDLIRAIADEDFATAIQAAQQSIKIAGTNAEEAERGLNELNEKWAKVREARKMYNEGLLELQESWAGTLNDSFLGTITGRETTEEQLRKAIEEQNPAALQLLEEFGGREDLLLKAIEENKKTIQLAQEGEKKAVAELIQSIATGETALPTIYADLSESIRSYLQTASQAEIDAIITGLTEGDKEFTEDALLEALLTAQGVDPGFIAEILGRKQRERVRKVSADLQGIVDDLAAANEEARIAALEYTSENSKDLAEAIAAGIEAGNAKLEKELEDSLAEFTDKFGERIITIINQNQEGIQEAIDAAVKAGAAQGIDFGITAEDSIDDILGGSALVEAINKRITEDSTPEEIAQIAKEEGEKYEKLMLLILQEVVEAAGGAITDEQLALLTQIVEGRIQAIGDAVVAGANESKDNTEAVKKRFDDQKKEAEREADKAKKEAIEAVKKLREVEDLFLDAATQSREARERFIDATRGLSVNERVSFSFELDIAGINEDFDNQILELQRKIQDLELDGETDPAVLSRLKDQYGTIIAQLEQARDAEIAAASSFEASMERRSKALDVFIRDLYDIGIASKDTFTQVGAGITAAFAEYQKDLVTLVDITKDATTGLLDTLTTGIGDFIFDNENAWENFKKNMLNISRQIFEGFTKAFLQQAISSISGGEGSILGNALQPSPFGNTGTPGVGTGGLLGKLFPGLGGAGSTGGATGNNPLGPVLQQTAVSTKQVYDENLVATRSTFQQFQTGLQQAMNSLVTAVQGMATGLGAGGEAILPGITAGVSGATSALQTAGTAVVTALGNGIASEADIFQGLIERGLNPAVAAGAVGNFIKESGLDAGINEINPLVEGSRGGYGLYQLTGPRRRDYEAYASSMGVPLNSVDAQLDYFIKELQTTEQATLAALEGVTDPQVASDIIAKKFLRPAEETANYGGRAEDAQRVFDEYAGQLDGSTQALSEFNSNMTGIVGQTQQVYDQFGNLLSGPINPEGKYFDQAGNPLNTQALVAAQTPAPVAPAATNPLAAVTGQQQGAPGADLMAISKQLSTSMQQFVSAITQTLNQFGTQFAQALNGALQQMGAPGGVTFAAGAGGAGGGAGLGGLLGGLGGLLGFAEGGYTGPGGKYDLAGLVHAGEFVANKEATKEFYPLLEAINNGELKPEIAEAVLNAMGMKMPGYANGGYVKQLGSFNPYSSVTGVASIFDDRPSYARRDDAREMAPTRSGDSIVLNATYHISGNADPNSFARSASQHSKILMRQIERAKKNT